MTWLEDVRSLIETLPRDFTLAELQPYYGGLKASHPANHHVEEKVRQMLQILEKSGELERLERGVYRRTGNSPIRLWPLSPGDETTRAELSTVLGMDGIQGLNRGMFKLRTGPHNRDLLLFQQANGPYEDKRAQDQRFIYVGMGQAQHGNQKWEGMNRYLGEHLERGLTPHLFQQVTPGSPALEYVGEMLCEGVQEVYIEQEGRVVFEFTLVPIADSKTAATAFSETLVRMAEEPNLSPRVENRARVVSQVERFARDHAFARVVRHEYKQRCAVCGTPLARGIYVDLQGAHVRSVAAGGPDEVNNGLCLCARHHWAFDRGVFTLGDDYQIQLHPRARDDPHGELVAGEAIRLPDEETRAPHPDYLLHHRLTFGFEGRSGL